MNNDNDNDAVGLEDRLCTESHYAVIVVAQKDNEIYQLGDSDCPICLASMANKHAALAEVFRLRLAALKRVKRFCVYGDMCLNPIYCDERDACCEGDPDCRKEPT